MNSTRDERPFIFYYEAPYIISIALFLIMKRFQKIKYFMKYSRNPNHIEIDDDFFFFSRGVFIGYKKKIKNGQLRFY